MKHYEKRRSVSGRLFVLMLALVLVLGCAVGGTVAWLVAKTDPVVNTFTYGDINITLTETTGENYKIIPGVDIGKDPKVTVKAGSEACWLFVKVEEEGTFVADIPYLRLPCRPRALTLPPPLLMPLLVSNTTPGAAPLPTGSNSKRFRIRSVPLGVQTI